MPTIVIDPGHGGRDPGAVGHGLREKDIVLDVSRYIHNYLTEKYQVESKLTRDKDEFIELHHRSGFSNRLTADCFISVHVNSATNNSANGFESFILETLPATAKAVQLQNEIHNRTAKLWTDKGRRDRGKKRANFHVIRATNAPAILVELGFIVNSEDAKLLSDSKFLQANAEAIAEGAAAFLGLDRKASKPNPKPAPKPNAKPNTRPANSAVYRVIINGKQTGAFSNPENVASQVLEAIEAKAASININRV